MAMKHAEEKALDILCPEIVKRLDPTDNVLQFLHDRQAITAVVYTRILEETIRPEQSRLLINTVKRKEIVPMFIEALEHEGSHRNLAKKLREKITELKSETEISESKSACVIYKKTGKIDIMTGNKKMLTKISFELRVLSSAGKQGLKLFDQCVSNIRRIYSHDPDFLFEILESEAAKRRMYNEEGDQTDPLNEMERLVASLTHSDAGAMTYLARKGSAIAMKGDIAGALHYLEKAKAKATMIKPCKDTGMMMYVLVNILMQAYESHPTAHHKQVLIENLLEAIEVHFAQTSPEMRDEFNRIFFLKLAFCYLGIGVFGRVINCNVTSVDLEKAENCFKKIEKIPGVFDKRRSMFMSLARAVMNCRYGPRFYSRAMQLAEEAEILADTCGFKMELESIQDLLAHLRGKCRRYDVKHDLEKDLEDLGVIIESFEAMDVAHDQEGSFEEEMDIVE